MKKAEWKTVDFYNPIDGLYDGGYEFYWSHQDENFNVFTIGNFSSITNLIKTIISSLSKDSSILYYRKQELELPTHKEVMSKLSHDIRNGSPNIGAIESAVLYLLESPMEVLS